MIKEFQLRVLPEEAANEQALKQVVFREGGIRPEDISAIRVVKRSVDARQRTIFFNMKLRVFINEEPEELEYVPTEYKDVSAGKHYSFWETFCTAGILHIYYIIIVKFFFDYLKNVYTSILLIHFHYLIFFQHL